MLCLLLSFSSWWLSLLLSLLLYISIACIVYVSILGAMANISFKMRNYGWVAALLRTMGDHSTTKKHQPNPILQPFMSGLSVWFITRKSAWFQVASKGPSSSKPPSVDSHIISTCAVFKTIRINLLFDDDGWLKTGIPSSWTVTISQQPLFPWWRNHPVMLKSQCFMLHSHPWWHELNLRLFDGWVTFDPRLVAMVTLW